MMDDETFTAGELRLVTLASEQLKWIQRLFWLTLTVWVVIPVAAAVVAAVVLTEHPDYVLAVFGPLLSIGATLLFVAVFIELVNLVTRSRRRG